MKKILKWFIVIPMLYFTTLSALACTSVFSNDTGKANVVARSMDLFTSDSPAIVVSPRGVTRNGQAGAHSIQWQAKYGSVAIAEFNTPAISDGMNEAGLAVHLLYLAKTKYEHRDNKLPGLANVYWGQYLLDNFKTVSEALKNSHQFQVISIPLQGKEWPIHLSMQDANGDSAVIEFINGKMNVYHGPQYKVMTNEPAYQIQLANLKRYLAFGGKLTLPGEPDPLSRFVRVSAYLKTLPPPKTDLEAIANILSIIRIATVPFGAVDQSGNKTVDAWATRWIAMADLNNKIYYFNSTMTPNIIWLDLQNLNFNEDAPKLSINPIDQNLVGEISQKMQPV